MPEKFEGGVPSPEKENKMQYTLVATEGSFNEGTRRVYLPVLSDKVQEYYEESQCYITQFTGSLEEVLAEAEKRAQEDEKSENYISVYVETPDERASRRPADKEFVLPEEEE